MRSGFFQGFCGDWRFFVRSINNGTCCFNKSPVVSLVRNKELAAAKILMCPNVSSLWWQMKYPCISYVKMVMVMEL